MNRHFILSYLFTYFQALQKMTTGCEGVLDKDMGYAEGHIQVPAYGKAQLHRRINLNSKTMT